MAIWCEWVTKTKQRSKCLLLSLSSVGCGVSYGFLWFVMSYSIGWRLYTVKCQYGRVTERRGRGRRRVMDAAFSLEASEGTRARAKYLFESIMHNSW